MGGVDIGSRRFEAPESYANKLATTLRDDIENGVFAVGDRLPTESEIGSTFGVSRAVVREAISALKHEGFIESFQGKGIFVATRQPLLSFRIGDADLQDGKEAHDIIEFLLANEVMATAIAAQRRTKKTMAAIQDAFDRMQVAIDRGDTGIDEDVLFHAAIVAATENKFYISFGAFLENRVRHLIRRARENSSRSGLTLLVQDEHRLIYEAIKAQNPDAAREAAESHLRNAGARLQSYHYRPSSNG